MREQWSMRATADAHCSCRCGFALIVAAHLVAAACGHRDDDDDDDEVPGLFGDVASMVVIVNPVINQGSNTTVQPGAERGGIVVSIAETTPSVADTTDDTGLAVLSPALTGPNSLRFEEAGAITVQVVQQRELYDMVVAVRAGAVEEIVPAVRYPVGGDVVVVQPGESVVEAAQEDGSIVVLAPGRHTGNFEVRAEGVLLFGAFSLDSLEPNSVIEGDVTWLGGNGRMRGVGVAGALTTNANGFSAAFNRIDSASVTGNGVSLIRNTFVGDAVVPSSRAVLVDNSGIPRAARCVRLERPLDGEPRHAHEALLADEQPGLLGGAATELSDRFLHDDTLLVWHQAKVARQDRRVIDDDVASRVTADDDRLRKDQGVGRGRGTCDDDDPSLEHRHVFRLVIDHSTTSKTWSVGNEPSMAMTLPLNPPRRA